MSEPAPQPAPEYTNWDNIRDQLAAQFPGQKDSVLFCVSKLQATPSAGLADLRDEATALGIPMAGRALHSAKVLLGMAQAKPRRPNKPKLADVPPQHAPASHKQAEDVIEDQVLSAVRQIQSAAGAEAERMRAAIRKAIEILQTALKN